ncbi:MAG: hypothetical protein DYG92_00135 [Leptolyngbya sp. PLA1]|nr:hypothetical protein [Leptolyngbya sp. PLA1]
MLHVAIVHRSLVPELLSGRKYVESRLSSRRSAPFGVVAVGDRIYFKASGGPFFATALAEHVEHFTFLTPRKVRLLARLYGDAVRATPEYWRSKLNARVGTFILLAKVTPVTEGPDYAAFPHYNRRAAWHAINDAGHFPRTPSPGPARPTCAV